MSWKGQLLRSGIRESEMVGGRLRTSNYGGQGKQIFVDCSKSASGGGRTPRTAKNTIALGEDALTANQNDELIYLQSSSGGTITDTLAWDKSYTHFIGHGPAPHYANRARIFNTGTATVGPLLNVSASGCLFENLYLFQGAAIAASGCVLVSGGRNVFRNVHFAGIGHATAAASASSYCLKLDGAEECDFIDCTIGVNTIKRTAAAKPLWIDGDSKRITFTRCRFVSFSDTAAHKFIVINDASAVDREIVFDRCEFINFSTNHTATLTEVADIPSSGQTKDFIFLDPVMIGVAEIDAGDETGTWVVGPTVAAGAGIGVTPTT